MKARDLAALAALGLGGAYLYNRNKGDAAPKGADKPAAPAAKEVVMPSEMPAYQGRSADRREDIQSEYGGDMNAGAGANKITPNTTGVPDTEVYKRSELDDLKGGRMPTRPGQSTSGVVKRPVAAAPLSSGRKPSVSQAKLAEAKYKDFNFDPALRSSKSVANSMQDTLDRQITANKAEKKAAATANSQAIIDRMSKRTWPYMKDEAGNDMKHGGAVKKMASGGAVKSSASSRGDGIAQRGKTRGRMC